MKRVLSLGLLLVLAGFAGCVGGEDADAGDDAEAGPSPAAANGTDGAAAEPALEDQEVSLAEPPTWSPGTWWEVEIEDANAGETYTIRRVVTGVDGGGYHVGMPADGFSHRAMVAHFPGMGEIDPNTLGFDVHGEPFQPLSFPLEEGRSWTTTLYEQDLNAEVVSASEGTAEVEMVLDDEDEEPWVSLTYDVRRGAVTSFEGPLGASMRVVDHGDGFEGAVKVPLDRDQFIDGRVVGAFDFAFEPAPPTGSVSVPSSFEEASFAQLVGNVDLGAPAQPGVYHETTTDPSGETMETTVAQAGGGFTVAYGSTEEAAGDWSFEHVAGGVGAAATEIIAYRTDTVELPLENATETRSP